ncbi:carbohydrate-binding module family 13 protein [Rhizophagus clarus]|uniref:Carbohydrate-binding module family 13 protein n=1 Tax=Rhizophagus clarus TaxID=94130 RepID=A0A8H3M7V3_9GLOM|nr:carbohydrate-binding module family 13 protein [Rhizophagus clarus]
MVHIKLPNILPEIFQIILRYIYGGRISLEEYDISDIIKVLVAGSELEKLLISLIQSDNLQMDEIQVWEHVLKWGLAQNPELPSDLSNFSKEDFKILKNNIRQCIPFIRFHNLSSEEFSDKVLPYRKILPKELLYEDLLKYFMNPNNQSIKKLKDRKSTKEINIDSTIITTKHAELISKWIDRLEITNEIENAYKFKLLLRGSRDGFTPKKFHEICDNQSHTVTVVKVKENNEILGGYNPVAWESSDDGIYKSTKDSFIFSFKNSNNIDGHILSRVEVENSAIYNYCYCGPSFGDFYFFGDHGFCNDCYYEKNIRESSDDFSVQEYEVFQIYKTN